MKWFLACMAVALLSGCVITPPEPPLTQKEADTLKRQLQACWNIDPRLMKDADHLAVDLSVSIDPDRTVRAVMIHDKKRFHTDRAFHAMAISALKALNNPRCSPLKLPPDRYTLWRTLDITFDPKDMP